MLGISNRRSRGSGPRRPSNRARPFLKWAGGKGQLLEALSGLFPKALSDGTVTDYYEPFLGGGAMFFHVMQEYPVRRAFLRDANEELVLLYLVVRDDVAKLTTWLEGMERDYLKLPAEKRQARFLRVREEFNTARKGIDFGKASAAWIERAAQLIFLNRTCYNGLFRVNSRAEFNTPFGRYAKPAIADTENLRAASLLLARAEITRGDFEELGTGIGRASPVKPGSFIYYDPPYRPLTSTANFTAYSRRKFGDEDQLRLARMFGDLDRKGVYQMLSNSDPRNADPDDDFFERAYARYRDRIRRVPAARSINSVAKSRGPVNEIVITNYRP